MEKSPTGQTEIAFFLPSLRGGGAERVMLDLAIRFAERGYAVDLVLVEAVGAYLPKVPLNVRLIDLGAKRVASSLPALVQYIRNVQPKILLSTMRHANIVAVLAGKIARRSTRVILREAVASNPVFQTISPVRVRVLGWMARWAYPKAAGIIAVSKGVSDDLTQRLGLSMEKIKVIYNPVISPQLAEQGAEQIDHQWFQNGEVPVILSVGRLAPEKDFSTLLKAFARLVKFHSARLVIVGEGKERERLENEICALGIAEFVDLPGFVENPFAYMSRASSYVLSSVAEGLPGALIQAAALGTPVVATDCPSGPREVLAGGKFGFLVPVEDEYALSEALIKSISESPAPIPSTVLEPFMASKVFDEYENYLLGGSC